jgi:hypothetical protein
MAKTARIQVSFEPHDYELIRRLAELQEQSMSAVVGDLFDSVSPVLERVCVVLEAARKAKRDAHAGIKQQVEKIEVEMRPLVTAALDQFDMFATFVEAAAEQGDGSERSERRTLPEQPKRARKASQPPHSNTGVRSRKAPILKVPKVLPKSKAPTASKGGRK